MLPIKICCKCVGSGFDLEYLVESKTMSFVDCKHCKGTGYRFWIDDILRPTGNKNGTEKGNSLAMD
jgi:hypothetical protein